MLLLVDLAFPFSSISSLTSPFLPFPPLLCLSHLPSILTSPWPYFYITLSSLLGLADFTPTISQFGIYGDGIESVLRYTYNLGFNVLCSAHTANTTVYWQFANGSRIDSNNHGFQAEHFLNGNYQVRIISFINSLTTTSTSFQVPLYFRLGQLNSTLVPSLYVMEGSTHVWPLIQMAVCT